MPIKSFRILTTILTLISCAFFLAAILCCCSGLGTPSVKTYKVGVSVYKFDDSFMTLYRNEIASYFKSLETAAVKYDVTIMDGNSDQARQNKQVDDFISHKAAVMIINLVQPSSADTVTQKAKAAKIPVVYINREPGEDDMQAWDKICYIGAKAQQSGTYMGEIIRDLPDHGDIDGDGTVRYAMIIGDRECSDSVYRSEYFVKALDSAGIRIKELSMGRGNFDMEKSRQVAAAALEQFGDKVDVIFCESDSMAMGAIQAIKASGRTVGKDVYLIGADAIPEAVDAIDAGDMTATVQDDYIGQVRAAVDAAVSFINSEEVATYVWVDYLKITADKPPAAKADTVRQ